MDGPGTGSHKAILEILCFSLECSKDIVVGNAARLDDFQQLSDCFICEISAAGTFSYQIVDVSNGKGGNTHDLHILSAAPLVKNSDQCQKGHP